MLLNHETSIGEIEIRMMAIAIEERLMMVSGLGEWFIQNIVEKFKDVALEALDYHPEELENIIGDYEEKVLDLENKRVSELQVHRHAH